MTDNDFKQTDTTSEPKKSLKGGSSFAQIVNGEFLTKDFVLNNLAYILFIFFLLFLMVAKGYYAKGVVKSLQETRRTLDQNTAEYIEAKTKLESMTRRYKMVERLEKRELIESQNAIKVIRIKPTSHE